MKSKKLVISLIVLLLLAASLVLFLIASYMAPYKYIENCFYSNKSDFEELPLYFQEMKAVGITSIKVDSDDTSNSHNKVITILENLKEQYQKDSDYPVFSSVSVDYDKNGNVLLYFYAKKEKLKNGDGIESPDIRVYYLVYMDENYNGNSKMSIVDDYNDPFYGNWYTWSSDTYSG